jgi:hypothetical protein
MTHVPPGGAGWGPPGQGATDPYAAQRAFSEWASQRGYELVAQPDARLYQAWYPFHFLRPIAGVSRELRVVVADARVSIVEVAFADTLGQVVGESRGLLFFALADALRYRAAVRTKRGGGMTDDLSRGLKEVGDFFSRGLQQPPVPGSLLGDPVLEQRCEVLVPSPQEGNLALPMPLRQILTHPSFQGVVELRPGGMAVQMYDLGALDVASVEQGVVRMKQLLDAATAYPPGA